MKIRLVILASIVAMASSSYALAADDYERLKKDVGVMSQIIDSVFKADKECGQCKVSVVGKYLADQGIVFLVNSRSHGFSWISGGDSHNNYSFSIDDFEDFEHIPEMVEGIIADVLPSIPDVPDVPREDWTRIIRITGDSTREAIREIRRERRELQQEIRENEIEMIHMEEDEAKTLEASIKEMEKAMVELEKQQAQIEEKVHTNREEYRKTREEARKKKTQLRQEQQKLIQDKVLQAFCDYGSALRSLPSKEKVTIIFENTHTEPRQDTVLIFDQNKITDCNRDKGALRGQALTYLF
jgi:hypothetical protein